MSNKLISADSKNTGFTLIELLISLAIITTLIAVIYPLTIHVSQSLRENRELELLVLRISHFQRMAYIYSTEYRIYVKGNKLFVDSEPLLENSSLSPTIDRDIFLYPQGTSSGGTIKLSGKTVTYRITVTPLGEIILER